MKNIKTLFPIIFFLFTMLSCSNSYKVQEGDIDVHVTVSAGNNFEYRNGTNSITFLPYITNEGKANVNSKMQNIAVVGKRIGSGKHIYARPFATLTYHHEQKEHKIIIAIPAEKKYRSMEIDSYSAFITEYFASKQLIEYWYANRYGLGGVSNVSWSSF